MFSNIPSSSPRAVAADPSRSDIAMDMERHLPAAVPSMRRLPVIDALRGLAVLCVLLFHSRIGFYPAGDDATLRPFASGLERELSFGWLGVSIFFAISGWCI